MRAEGPDQARSDDAQRAVLLRDYPRAAQIWSELAQQGDRDAQYRLGSLYRSGRGVAKSHEKAVQWFRKAAEAGHPGAQ